MVLSRLDIELSKLNDSALTRMMAQLNASYCSTAGIAMQMIETVTNTQLKIVRIFTKHYHFHQFFPPAQV